MKKKMKKKMKKIASILLGVVLVISSCMIPSKEAEAAMSNEVSYSKNITVSAQGKYGAFYWLYMGKKVEGAKMVTLKSSNKKVVKVAEKENVGKWINFNARKPGTAKLTITVKKGNKIKKYTTKIKVVKYKNPVKVMKIGRKNVASKFKKQVSNASYRTKATKAKLSIKPVSGWKLKEIRGYSAYPVDYKKLKNNRTFSVKKYGGVLEVDFYHVKTKVKETISLEIY